MQLRLKLVLRRLYNMHNSSHSSGYINSVTQLGHGLHCSGYIARAAQDIARAAQAIAYTARATAYTAQA